MGFLLLGVCIILGSIWFFSSSYWNDYYYWNIVARAKENTLAPIVATLVGLLTLTSVLLSCFFYIRGKWKASLSLKFYSLTYEGLKEINPRKIWSRKGPLSPGSQSSNTAPTFSETYMPYYKEADIVPPHFLPIDVVCFAVHNTGRSILRFSEPLIKITPKFSTSIPWFAVQKNKVFITANDNSHLSIDSGENVEFMYSAHKIINYFSWAFHSKTPKKFEINFEIDDNAGKKIDISPFQRWTLLRTQERLRSNISYQMRINEFTHFANFVGKRIQELKVELERNDKHTAIQNEKLNRELAHCTQQYSEAIEERNALIKMEAISHSMQLVFDALNEFVSSVEEAVSLKDRYTVTYLLSEYLWEKNILIYNREKEALEINKDNFLNYRSSEVSNLLTKNALQNVFPHPEGFIENFYKFIQISKMYY